MQNYQIIWLILISFEIIVIYLFIRTNITNPIFALKKEIADFVSKIVEPIAIPDEKDLLSIHHVDKSKTEGDIQNSPVKAARDIKEKPS